ncbi:agmatine deiminase family protein [Hyphobacterium sp.]|uniref:agmatine deiminase family protein n=1 Tax=Hyphobacterium sp. TaxID=2004662 RepID=UPI003BABDC13
MWRWMLAFFMAVLISACSQSQETDSMPADPELIILAAPQYGDPYYAEVYDDIIAFQSEFGRRIISAGDDVIILSDEAGAVAFADALGSAHVAIYPVEDIWARDFGTSNAANPVFFRYTAAGQGGGVRGQLDADAVQDGLWSLVEAAGLPLAETDLLNDGGNFVDDYAGAVVISRKFLRDNGLTETEAREAIGAITGAAGIAFIEADEQGGLEHADGVVSFIGPNTVIINSYPEDPDYAAALRADLQAGLPDVVIHEVPTPYDPSDIYDERFGSACGLYTNALVTPHRIYLPQFGIQEDQIVLEQVSRLTDREVVPVQSSGVCYMGGGVRCMSWQMRGENAERIAGYLRREHGFAED